MQTIP
ncbi:hypothetical protein CGLO_14079 [Colletotrichum gloeosporioides Cg-14]